MEFQAAYGSDHSVNGPSLGAGNTLKVGGTSYALLVDFPASPARSALYVANTSGATAFLVLDDAPFTVVPLAGSGTEGVAGESYTGADISRVRVYGTAGKQLSAREITTAVVT